MSASTMNRIIDLFDSHQRSHHSRDSSSCAAIESTSTKAALIQLYQCLHDDNAFSCHSGSDQEKQLSLDAFAETLVRIITAALSNVVQEGLVSASQLRLSNWKETLMTIWDLCALFVGSFSYLSSSSTLVEMILDPIGPFAAVEMESIRVLVVEFSHRCLIHLISDEAVSNLNLAQFAKFYNSSWSNADPKWRNDCITRIKDVLLPRLKDKSQAVRSIAVEACGVIFHSSTFSSLSSTSSSHSSANPQKYYHSELYHPDVVEALLWNVRHDPSFTNRSLALKAIPVNTSTIPDIIERVRDSKIKVRVDALEVLRTRVDVHDLSSYQRAQILQIGLSKRYPETLVEASKMLCCGWMKSNKFDPIQTLELLDPVLHEDVCMQSAKILLTVASQDFAHSDSSEFALETVLSDLSPPEIRSFQEQILKKTCIETQESLNAATILFMCATCDMIQESKSLSDHKKASRLSDIVPDVTVLGQVLMEHIKTLESISDQLQVFQEQQDDANIEIYEHKEESESFICLYLLKLSKVVDLTEEGSRRHFSSILHRILSNIMTHEDLIEVCVHALLASHDNENSFLIALSEILATIIPNEEDLVEDKNEKRSRFVRGISILSMALEKMSRKMSSNPILQNFSSIILSSITDPTLGNLVREAGVSCLGRYVILMEESVIMDKFKPILMEIAYSDKERVDIRAQALFAITDLSLLFPRFLSPVSLGAYDNDISVTDLLLHCLCDDNASLSIISAECSAKLLLNGKIHDASILGQLIVMYFDNTLSIDEDDDDSEEAVKEVGNPTRLHQLLTIFFPAYSMSCKIARDTLKASFRPILDIIHKIMTNKKKGKKNASAWPIAKIIDYICQTMESEESVLAMKEENKDDLDASPLLMATIAICEFVQEEVDNMTVTHLRNLCKLLSKTYIDIESEDKVALTLLKRRVGDLYDGIDDSSASRSIEPLVVMLDEVIDENEDEPTDDDYARDSKEDSKEQNVRMGALKVIANVEHESEEKDMSVQSEVESTVSNESTGMDSDEFDSEEDSD